MGKSILKSIVREMVNDTTRRQFIDKIHDETGIDKISIEEAYDTSKIPAESKGNVYTLIEKTKWVNPDVKDTRRTRQNPVAKHARTYSKSGGVHAGKDKTYSRRVKHRNRTFEDSDTVDDKTVKFAKWLSFKILKDDKTPEEARKHADELERRGESSHTVTAWRMAADMVEKHDSKSSVEEVSATAIKDIENRRDNVQVRKLTNNLMAAGKTYQYAYKRANELKAEEKPGSARVWAKAAYRLAHAEQKSNVPEDVGDVPPNLSRISKLRNMARHNDFEVFRGGESEVIFNKYNLTFMWDENNNKLHRRFKRKWNEFGSFGPSSEAEEIWQAIEDNVAMGVRPKAIGERGDPKEHQEMWQIWNYRKKEWVGKPSPNKSRLRNRVDKLDSDYGAYSYQVKRAS